MDPNGTAELQGLVVQALEARGSLANLRASLRAAVYCAIHEQGSINKNSLLPPPKNLKAVQAAPHGQLMLALVREALVAVGFQKTLSVFDHESVSGGNFPLEEVHAAVVGTALSAGPSLTGRLENAATQGLPLMLALVQCCASDSDVSSIFLAAARHSDHAVSSVPESKEIFPPTSNDAPLSPPKPFDAKQASLDPSSSTPQSYLEKTKEDADNYDELSFEEDKNVSAEDAVFERDSTTAEEITDVAVEAFTPPSPPRASFAPKEPMPVVSSVEADGEASDSDVVSEEELGSEPDDSDSAEGASGTADSHSFSGKAPSRMDELQADSKAVEEENAAHSSSEAQDIPGQEEKGGESDSAPSTALEAAEEDSAQERSDITEAAALAQQPTLDDTKDNGGSSSDDAAGMVDEGQDNMAGKLPVVESELKAVDDVDGPSPESEQGDANATSTSDQSDHDIPPRPPVVPDASPSPSPPPPPSTGSSLPPLSTLPPLQSSLTKLTSASTGDDDDDDEYDFDQGVKPKGAVVPELSASAAQAVEPRAGEELKEVDGGGALEVADGADESDADALLVSVGESEASFGDLEVMCDEIEVAEAYTPTVAALPPPPTHEPDPDTLETLKPPPAAAAAAVTTELADKSMPEKSGKSDFTSGKAEASDDEVDEYGSDFDDDDASAEAEELDDVGDEIEVAASDDEDAYIF